MKVRNACIFVFGPLGDVHFRRSFWGTFKSGVGAHENILARNLVPFAILRGVKSRNGCIFEIRVFLCTLQVRRETAEFIFHARLC